jgi:hypothetical protein
MSTAWSHTLRQIVAGVAVMAAIPMVAACGFFGAASGSPSPSGPTSSVSTQPSHPSPSSSATSAPSTSGSSTTGGLSRCRSTNLTVSLVQQQAAAGSAIRTYAFTNTAATACTLYGYPGFQLMGSNGQLLPTSVQWVPATKSVVTLSPGGHAWFTMEFPAQTGYGNLTCPTSSALRVTPPNAYHFVTVTGAAGAIQAYGGTTTDLHCGTLSVQPVTGTPPTS